MLSMVNHIGVSDHGEDGTDFRYGLGLELVQWLSDKLGWRLQYQNEEQCFIVILEFFPSVPRAVPQDNFSQ